MKHTALGYALIGLVQEDPRSGYALRKVFEDTPMGTFSSSPGSIYPALKKLVQAGTLEQKPRAQGGKTVFHITPKGQREMQAWLETPVTQAEVASSIDLALLRFAFLQTQTNLQITHRFLASFEVAIRSHIDELQAYLSSAESAGLSRHARLAVENGLRGYQAHLDWAIHAAKVFQL